jgi:hypothetical protein
VTGLEVLAQSTGGLHRNLEAETIVLQRPDLIVPASFSIVTAQRRATTAGREGG